MRRLLLLAPVVVALGACGGRERTPALAPVKLTLTEPSDRARVDDRTVVVRGAVEPASARVRVDGVEAEVRGGEFSATVTLSGGANVIDVQAAAPRHPAAMTAVRITRLVPVSVPDLDDYPVDEAVSALEALGLEADVRDSGLIDSIFPGDAHVCATTPGTGERVRVGTTVTLVTGKTC